MTDDKGKRPGGGRRRRSDASGAAAARAVMRRRRGEARGRPWLWTLAGGLWLPVIQAGLVFARFGSLPPEPSLLVGLLLFYVVGCLSVRMLLAAMRLRPRAAPWLFGAAALLALPASVVGGLFGPLGVLLYGLFPFLLAWGVVALTLLPAKVRARRGGRGRPAGGGG